MVEGRNADKKNYGEGRTNTKLKGVNKTNNAIHWIVIYPVDSGHIQVFFVHVFFRPLINDRYKRDLFSKEYIHH